MHSFRNKNNHLCVILNCIPEKGAQKKQNTTSLY